MNSWEFLKNLYWKIPFFSEERKEKIFYDIRAIVRG